MPTEDKMNKTIAVVTYPGVALLDLVATKTVLDSLAMGTRYRSVTVGKRTEPIASNTPMRIIPEKRCALILGSVGLLEGRQATTHCAFYKVLEEFGAKYIRKRWVEDGKFICSAGVSAGIDMALQLAARLTDEQTSREVQYRLGYDPEPPFRGIDYEQIGGQLGIWRAGVSLAAPVIAAKPKRLFR
jgi:putative intracellular protease/amidase